MTGGAEGARERAEKTERTGDETAAVEPQPGPRSTDGPGNADGPDPATGPRPADIARRALRAARERDRYGAEAVDHQGPYPAPGAEEPRPDETSGDRPAPSTAPRTAARAPARPGDRAREALRRAADRAPAEPTEPGESRHDAGSDPAVRADEGGRPAARPGDIAREALRAARDAAVRARGEAEDTHTDAEGTRAETADREGRTSRRTTTGRDRSTGRHSAAGARARELRELLADAFKLPPDEPEPEPQPDRAPDHDLAPTPDETSTTARVPRTMAAPSRDGELRRTFRPFPPRPSTGEPFAGSWWGNAWVTALEEGALDSARLARGRVYADKGHVDAITVTPGLVLAYVHGSRPRPYRVQLTLRTLDDDAWDRFLDAAADHPGHIAALLDKELPHALSDPAGEPGVRLLPGPGELEPRCSCPDFGHPCKHAAALCYQTARLLDEDPFVLLLLRGRGERELIDALSRRNAARAARAAQTREPAPLPGVLAREALAPRTLPPLPAPSPPPPHPEQPPVYPGAPGGPDPFALDQLATDAAARAHALLTTGRDAVAELTLWQDAVRLAAARPGSGLTATTRALYSSLAAATGRTPADLARAVAAWRQGGLEGLAVLEEPWDPPAGRFDRARPLLLAADLPAFRPRRNHLTHPHGHLQLRLGRDGLWYAYESEPGHDDWWPRGTPDLDPVGALTGLGTADD
ncbi:SWIM zinc finger family protein [Streptomyces brasiliscabiei]|uniref:SWIM zinc finger family protein n=1 Tax=Streptomyces brasiliscabiei TaxID=2736302 RepID=UPI0038F6FC61